MKTYYRETFWDALLAATDQMEHSSSPISSKMYTRSLFLASCLLLIAVASSQYCNWNEVEVECVNECNTCGQRTVCVTDCNPGCDCIPGYYRNWYGVCIAERFCGPAPYQVEVADDSGCPGKSNRCPRSCVRMGRKGGFCRGRRCICY